MSKRKNEIIAGEMNNIPVIVSIDPNRKEGNFLTMTFEDCGIRLQSKGKEIASMFASLGGGFTFSIKDDPRTYVIDNKSIWNSFCNAIDRKDLILD